MLEEKHFRFYDDSGLLGVAIRRFDTSILEIFLSYHRLNGRQFTVDQIREEFEFYLSRGIAPPEVRLHATRMLIGTELFIGNDKSAFLA